MNSSQLTHPRNKDLNKSFLDPRNPRKTQQWTDNMADYMVDKFQSPNHRNFFLKAAWRLEPATLMRLITAALESSADSKRAYFIKSVKREPAYYS